MIISPPCLFKHTKNNERVATLYQWILDHTQQTFYFCLISLLRNNVSKSVYINFKHSVYLLSDICYRATLGAKGSITIRQNILLRFFWCISILYHFHILRKCFRKNLCVYVCVCLCVCLCVCVTVAERSPKSVDQFASNSSLKSSCKYLQISSYPPTLKVWVVHIRKVDPGGPVFIILTTKSEVPGFDPGRGRWTFSEGKNPEYGFLRKGSKAVGPVSYIYGT